MGKNVSLIKPVFVRFHLVELPALARCQFLGLQLKFAYLEGGARKQDYVEGELEYHHQVQVQEILEFAVCNEPNFNWGNSHRFVCMYQVKSRSSCRNRAGRPWELCPCDPRGTQTGT